MFVETEFPEKIKYSGKTLYFVFDFKRTFNEWVVEEIYWEIKKSEDRDRVGPTYRANKLEISEFR